MQASDTRSKLWPRIHALMVQRYGAENQNRLARDARVGVATVSRIKNADTSVGLDVLERIAGALGVEAWQLIYPQDLQADGLPARLSPMALDLARSLDGIADQVVRRKVYAVALQVVSFGVDQLATGAGHAVEHAATGEPLPHR